MAWLLAYVITSWIIRLVMIPIVARRHRLIGALGWLSVIFLIPWLGLVLYLIMGSNPLSRPRMKRREAQEQEFEQQPQVAEQQDVFASSSAEISEVESQHTELARTVRLLERMPPTRGNRGELLPGTGPVIDRLIEDIDAAREHVHVLVYIFAADQTGRRIAEALVRARQRGVRCRVLVDAAGSVTPLKQLDDWMEKQGVQMRVMLQANPLRRRVARMDVRNHRKLAVIDGRIAYAGSMNIINSDYGTGKYTWYDLTARLEGPIVHQLQVVFLRDWYALMQRLPEEAELFPQPREAPELQAGGEGPERWMIQTAPSGPTRSSNMIRDLIVAAVYDARQRVIITSPYIIPEQPLLQAMRIAVRRGVRVDVVTAASGKGKLVHWASYGYFGDLLEAGVRIHIHQPGLLHAKTLTVDDSWGMMGSANFDTRSFLLNYELSLLLYGSASTAALRREQELYLSHAQELTQEQWGNRSSGRAVVQDCAKLLSPLL